MPNPPVSVVIPAYNAEKTIAATVEHVRAQTLHPLEILVVDDGSGDRTFEIAASLAGVRCIRQDNAGPSAGRNTGIRAAAGEWIAFLDADDGWLPHKLEAQLGVIRQHPELDFVFTDAEITRGGAGDSKTFSVFRSKRLDETYFGSDWQLIDAPTKLLRDNIITTSSVLARKSLLNTFSFNPNRRYAEDWELWLTLSPQAAMGYVPEVCVRKFEDGGGLSSRRKDMLLSRLEVFEAFIAAQRAAIRLSDQDLAALAADQWHWAGVYLEQARDGGPARRCYRRALRHRLGLKSAGRYLWSWITAP